MRGTAVSASRRVRYHEDSLMTKKKIAVHLFALLLLAAGVPRVTGQSLSNLPRARDVVKPEAYVSLQPVPRGRTFEVAVVARIAPGFHINAHKVFEDYLIPTTLQAELPTGLHLVETLYPEGELQKFDFSEKMLNVYDGTVTLRMKLRTSANAPLGRRSVPLALRYQACNDRACLPPVKLSVPVELTIAAAGAKAKAAYPEIFQKSKTAPEEQH